MVAAAAAAASPSPAPAPHAAASRPHPTYTKMITQALTELGGASRRGAIAARIRGRGYSGLPARHDDLLSAHLRRLLAEGVLRLDGSSSCTYLLAPKPPAGGEEEQKRGPGRPRKEKPGSAAASTSRGFKRGYGRPRKDQPVGGGEDGKDTSAAGAVGSDHLGSAGASVEPEGGTPRMEESAAARSPETTGDAAASTAGVKRGRGRPPKKKPATTGAKRGRGRPRKEKLASAAATTGVKRGRGRPRKEKLASAAAATGVKRGRGRPKKAGSVGTWYAESATERELFGDMAEEEEAPGDSLSAGKTMQAEGVVVAPGDREEAPGVSGGNAATAPAEAGNGSASLL